MSRVILKPGKDRSVLRRHPWIFSGAIDHFPPCVEGDILPVYAASGELLGSAYFHPKNSIAGRMLSFGAEPALEAVFRKLSEAISLRQELVAEEACRLVNAEGDGIPGLIVDKYRDVLVVQVSTHGIERLKSKIVEKLVELLVPRSIYEKSASNARRQEGLKNVQGVLYGEKVGEIPIIENGIEYLVSIEEGQKTGFFLDQRRMRKKILSLAAGKRVLNCFSYTGGFSLAALKGGAVHVDSIDISPKACELAQRMNPDPERHKIVCQDVFDFLKASKMDYGVVILDPPAFAKKKGDLTAACQAYKELNRLVIEKAKPGTILLTSSCSAHVDETLFQNLLFQAALEVKRMVRILSRHEQAWDHPVALDHPEGDYLKSLMLYIGGEYGIGSQGRPIAVSCC